MEETSPGGPGSKTTEHGTINPRKRRNSDLGNHGTTTEDQQSVDRKISTKSQGGWTEDSKNSLTLQLDLEEKQANGLDMSGEKENLSGNVGDAGIQFPPGKRNRKGRSGRKQKSTIDEGSHQEVMSPHSKSIRGTKAGGCHAILFALDQTELEDEQSSPSDGNTASSFSTSDNVTQDTEFEGQGRYLKSTISLDDSNDVKLEESALLAFPGHVDFQELVEQQRKNEQERPEQFGKYSSGMAHSAWARTRMTDADAEVSTPSERSEHMQQHSSLVGSNAAAPDVGTNLNSVPSLTVSGIDTILPHRAALTLQYQNCYSFDDFDRTIAVAFGNAMDNTGGAAAGYPTMGPTICLIDDVESQDQSERPSIGAFCKIRCPSKTISNTPLKVWQANARSVLVLEKYFREPLATILRWPGLQPAVALCLPKGWLPQLVTMVRRSPDLNSLGTLHSALHSQMHIVNARPTMLQVRRYLKLKDL